MKKFQVFTPEQYVDMMLDEAGYFGEIILKKNFLENSAGDGNILSRAITRYIKEGVNIGYDLSVIKSDLENYFVAFEVDKKLITKCINRLNKITESFGIFNVQWDIRNEDYLKSDIYKKFDFIVGNPPYITYQELNSNAREYLRENFISCNKGKFDYCYAFIEKSLTTISKAEGTLVYLIPSSIFKNVFAQNLRELMQLHLTKIIDYKYTSVFEKVFTSSAIIVIDTSSKSDVINYYDIDNQIELIIEKRELESRWYFEREKWKGISVTFGDLFKVSNSVATQSNTVFVLSGDIGLEKDLLRPAASPRNFSKNIEEAIIFPYRYESGNLLRYSEEEFIHFFPRGFNYLLENKEILDGRKSDGQWFEYGRSQALKFMNQKKLMLSSVVTDRVKVFELNEQTIPYSGFYIIPIADRDLEFAKKILESEKFFSYIETRAINASGRSLRLSVNDIKDYPIHL